MAIQRLSAASRAFVVALLSSAVLSGCGGGGGSSAPARPGSIQFETSTAGAQETAGGSTVSVIVTRTGGSDGAISATVDRQGTATAGSDYTISATAVTFAAGDTAAKTLTVTIADDTQPEPDETLTLTLVSPTDGATIGANSLTRITVADNDPPAAPALAPVSATMKQLQFAWQNVPNATSYRLLQSVDAGGAFAPAGAALPATATSTTLEVAAHSFNWIKTRYRVEACIADRCSASAQVAVGNLMLDAIGVTAAHNPGGGDGFASAIALSGDGKTLAVGAPGEGSDLTGVHAATEPGNEFALQSGAVYVFTREQGDWVPQAFIKASNTDADDRFGQSVSLSDDGNRLAVGAPRESSSGAPNDDSLASAGAVYVFERAGSQWSQQSYVKAGTPVPAAADQFGFSVAVSGDGRTLAVGTPGQDGLGAASGAAYAYVLNGSQWVQQDFLQAFNGLPNDAFGFAVSLSGDGNRLAVGAPGEDNLAEPNDNGGNNLGAIYVFRRLETVWSHDPFYLKKGDADGRRLGSAVALSRDGNTVAGGAPGESFGADSAGSITVFAFAAGQFTFQDHLFAFNPGLDDRLGSSVAVSRDGNVVAAGAIAESSSAQGIDGADNDDALNAGAVYVFKRSGTQWSAASTYVKSSATAEGSRFGQAVAVDDAGSVLCGGAPGQVGGGAVYTY